MLDLESPSVRLLSPLLLCVSCHASRRFLLLPVPQAALSELSTGSKKREMSYQPGSQQDTQVMSDGQNEEAPLKGPITEA